MALHRREFLQALGIGLATPWLSLACGPQAGGASGSSSSGGAVDPDEAFFKVEAGRDPAAVFSLGLASGDPTPSGVILWARVDPAAVQQGVKLAFEVAEDDGFTRVTARGLVLAEDVGPARDHCVKVDVDGKLQPGTRYAYRFIYNGTASRTAHCRTLPAASASPEQLKLILLTCQDFTNGYYGAMHLVAQEEADFAVHLGDFIYESAGDPRFQSLPFEDRSVIMPSAGKVAMDLEDYRAIYRRYREDARLQRAMEAHTFIMTWDDHETANDCYWDAANQRLGAPDHPYAMQPEKLNQLKLDSQRAWTEYVPARVTLQEDTQDPHAALSIYRAFTFGDLAHLVMTDERSYRSAPPCGLGNVGGRYVNTCEAVEDPGQTMLGAAQKAWFLDQVTQSTALWKLWGNEVLLSPLTVPKIGAGGPERDAMGNYVRVALSLDAWDGYAAERRTILQAFKDAHVENLLVLTGDLHSTIIAKAKVDPAGDASSANVAAVEFMTPAVTSANLSEIVKGQTGLTLNSFVLGIVRQMNPHMHYLDSDKWGYSTLTLTRTKAHFHVYSVDKAVDADPSTKSTLKAVDVDVGSTTIRDA